MAGENRTPGILLELRRMSRPERDLQLGASTFAGGALDRRTRMLLGHYLEQGMSKRALARKFGIRPDTLYRWIREVT